jgi:hypothetical protein
METHGSASEYLRIFEHYRAMADEELLALFPQMAELTPPAQQALANEIRQRGLQEKADAIVAELSTRPASITPAEWRAGQRATGGSSAPPPRYKPPQAFPDQQPETVTEEGSGEESNEGEDEDNYDEDRKLVELCTVYSQRDALEVQRILDVAGIPFFIGPENATGVDEVTSNFSDGLKVQIMRIGWPLARGPMSHFEPKDDPTPPSEPWEEKPVRCPVCNSTEVIFDESQSNDENPDDDVPQKFKWTCDSCGDEWEDDGVVKEA